VVVGMTDERIETLYAMYQQASSQRDVLMAQQTQLIEVWKQRIKEAKTEWQGLTFEDIDDIGASKDWIAGARWAEAKLKEKNA